MKAAKSSFVAGFWCLLVSTVSVNRSRSKATVYVPVMVDVLQASGCRDKKGDRKFYRSGSARVQCSGGIEYRLPRTEFKSKIRRLVLAAMAIAWFSG